MLPEVELGLVEVPDRNSCHILSGLHVYHHFFDAVGVLEIERCDNDQQVKSNREIKVEVEAETLLCSDHIAGYGRLLSGLAKLRICPEEES